MLLVDVAVWDRIVRREPIVSEGKSGAQLERGWLDDGSEVVIKHAVVDLDWVMQEAHDAGRIADMWEKGLFDRFPASIDHATLAVRRQPGGAEVLMTDRTASLFSQESELRACHLDVLDSIDALHRAFASVRVNGLCDLRDYYSVLSPRACAGHAAEHEVPRLALHGWTRFHELVPEEVSGAIDRLHADPAPLVDALMGYDATLVHGDLRMANLGMNGHRVVLLDWGTLTSWAPAAVDYAWYIATNAAALELEQSLLVEQCRRLLAPADQESLDLALLGEVVRLGWEKALGASMDEPAIRERETVGLAWWVERARAALARWPL
jgi:hypothetical protein